MWGATSASPSPHLLHPISIHAPRVGRDNVFALFFARSVVFQSTRPVWGATMILSAAEYLDDISIHAPRVGRDDMPQDRSPRRWHFNPRAPCGARRGERAVTYHENIFQSTRPVWGATHVATGLTIFVGYFNPRAPCGARRLPVFDIKVSAQFQSTRPVWGATGQVEIVEGSLGISIHAPRVGRDSKFDDFTPSNLHKRYKRVLARPKNTREKGKIKQKLAYIHAFSAFLGCEGSGTFCALVLRTQYR